MAKLTYAFPQHIKDARAMVFVDGENLAIRYGVKLGGREKVDHIEYENGVFVWSPVLNREHHETCEIIRRHYYTSVQGSGEDRDEIKDRLKMIGIEAPQVFRKDKVKGSKRVDISLTVDMLHHAHQRNYDVAVLVAGDEDYIPLVDAVKSEGRRVVLWFLEGRGLSRALQQSVDHFFDLTRYMFTAQEKLRSNYGVTW